LTASGICKISARREKHVNIDTGYQPWKTQLFAASGPKEDAKTNNATFDILPQVWERNHKYAISLPMVVA